MENKEINIPKFSEIEHAKRLMKGHLKVTPLEYSKTFSKMSGANVFMKLENFQTTGSFKVRGAYNKISQLGDEAKECGVVCASAGNHAQGVAYAATQRGIKSTIFMPLFTPPLKVIATRGYGADVRLIGDTFDDAKKEALKFCEEQNAIFVHPFDDNDIISGQGTIGLEIYDQCDDIHAVFVPVGGGGLIAGIAIAVKSINPDIKVIGVEPEHADSMFKTVQNKQIVTLDSVNTIADGIAVKTVGNITYEVVKQYVDDIITVNDNDIARATYLMLQRAKILAEPAGATAMAGILSNKINIEGKTVVPVISGGNINMLLLNQIIEKGLMMENLRARIAVTIPDQSGELKKIINILDNTRSNIQDIVHERSVSRVPVGFVLVIITFGLQNPEQLSMIETELKKRNLEYKIMN